MKRISTLLFLFLASFISNQVSAQTVNVSGSMITGTATYTVTGTPSNCSYYGIDEIPAGLDMAISGSPGSSCAALSDNFSYYALESNLANGVVVFRNTAVNLRYAYSSGYFQNNVRIDAELTVTFMNSSNQPLEVRLVNGNYIVPWNQNLKVTVKMEAWVQSLGSIMPTTIATGYANRTTPISLYNTIHTDPSYQMCSSFDIDFVTNTPTAGNISGGTTPICTGSNPGVMTANPSGTYVHFESIYYVVS